MAERVDMLLRDAGSRIDWPRSPSLNARVLAQIEERGRRPRGLRLGWAVAALALIAVVFVPTARHAVGHVLSFAGVDIEFFDDGSVQTDELGFGDPVSLASLDERVRVPSLLGRPGAVYRTDALVHMVWETDGVAEVIFTQGPGGDTYAIKGLGGETAVEHVEVDGVFGLWVSGAPHAFRLTHTEGSLSETTRLAANVLLWSKGQFDYRLETIGDLQAALEIVDSLEVVD